MIPYSRQSIDESDIEAVVDVLRGAWLTTGPAVQAFESALASRVDAKHAVALNSGTAALHAALFAAGIGEGHTVATTPISFSASANAALYVGARVTFVDIERTRPNLDPDMVPSSVDALIAVHFAGDPLDLRRLPQAPPVVIEDAAQALGASTPDGPVGNCARSDMTTFSFHPVKNITTGEGGAVTTNDDVLAERVRRFRNHGMIPTPQFGGWSYDIDELGYNYRLSDLHAALGRSQLRRLDDFLEARRDLAARYNDLLADVPGVQLPPHPTEGSEHAWHLYVVQVDQRRHVYDLLRSDGIGAQVHHMPIPALTAYRRLGFDDAEYPNAISFYQRSLSLPLFPELSHADQDRVVAALVAAVSS